MTTLNSNAMTIDSSGRVVFSGLGTGIDAKTAVDNIITAKRQPAISLENRITDNDERVAALKDLRDKLNSLKLAVSKMRGAITFGDVSNAFGVKQTFATTTRTDGLQPSAAGNLIGITAANTAALGSQTLEVRRLATAHKIASSTFASTTSALGLAGTFTINNGTSPTTITVTATDTLTDLRDRINNANTGTNATKVTATIVSISSTQHVLTLTNDTLGTNLTITDAGTVLSGLGLSSNNGTSFTNVLQRAETARMTANGLTNPKHFESGRVGDQNAQLSSFLTGATFPGSFTINGTGAATVNYTGATTLSGLATLINNETGTTGVTATVVQDGNGYRLDLDSASDFTLSDTNGLLADLDVNNLQIIERTSNTVTDLFSGLTLSLFGAEAGTTIKIDVERNLTSVKSEIEGFVSAYNDVRKLINENNLRNADGSKADNAGPLFGAPIISDLRVALGKVIGGSTRGVTNDFAGLRAIGITLVDNSTVSDDLNKDTLEIDATTLDEALLNNAEDVRRLFSFSMTSSSPNVVLLGFTGKTSYSATGYTLNVGTLGDLHKSSAQITSQTALLNTAQSFNAAVSGTFTVNGALVTYDVTTDTLDSLVTKINGASVAAGTGVTARVVAGSSGTVKLELNSTQGTVTLAGDTGSLVAAMAVTADTSKLDFANIGGAGAGTNNGTVTVNGRNIEVTDQSGAEGLRLFYSGTGSQSGITLNYTVGLAQRLSAALDTFVDTVDGSIEVQLVGLDAQNQLAQKRIDEMDKRLAILRASLTDRFLRMESSVTSMRQLLDSLKTQFQAMTSSRN